MATTTWALVKELMAAIDVTLRRIHFLILEIRVKSFPIGISDQSLSRETQSHCVVRVLPIHLADCSGVYHRIIQYLSPYCSWQVDGQEAANVCLKVLSVTKSSVYQWPLANGNLKMDQWVPVKYIYGIAPNLTQNPALRESVSRLVVALGNGGWQQCGNRLSLNRWWWAINGYGVLASVQSLAPVPYSEWPVTFYGECSAAHDRLCWL